MSFAFMPFYTGDYLRDTQHLTPAKHGIYLKLLMHSWDSKGPAPLDEQECAGICNCRSADEIESLRYILNRYFVRMADGWYNDRMQREVERAEAVSRVRADAGRKGYEAKAKQLPSKCSASATTPTPTPITTTTTTKAKPKAPGKPVPSPSGLPEWLEPADWQAYLDHRTRLRKPMTAEAQRRAIEEIRKLRDAGHDPAKVIDQSLVKGWVGLFPVKDSLPQDRVASQAARVAKMLFPDQPEKEIVDG